MQESEQEILLNTLAETPQEEVRTLEEDIYVIGVESLNGKAGDLTLKNINGEDLVGTGNIALATQSAFNELSATVATKQDALSETQLEAVNSGIDSTKVGQIATNASNITTLQNTKQDNLTQPQLNAVNSGIDATKVAQIATNTGNITSNTNRITTIENKIPSTATSTNQLTDKNYVDNSIATNTANYISDNGQPFQSLADLEAYSGPLTNNDYAFVVSTDSAGNLLYTRYKYNSTTEQWAEEYTIANPTFTSTQWASINSGVTANDVSQIGTNKSDIATLTTSKQDKLTTAQQSAVDSGIDATKVQQIATNASNITNLQNDKQDKLVAGTNIQIASDGKTISATDTTYTAGTGLTLTGTQFSVTEPVPSGFFTDTQGTQTGEGTAITLNHTPNAPIDNVELKGGTFQQTYSGTNLIPFTNQDFTLKSVRVYAQDGNLYLDGTSSADASSNDSLWKNNMAWTLPAGTYTLSAKDHTYVNNEQFFLHKADTTDIAYIKPTTEQTITFTLNEDTAVYLGIFYPASHTWNNAEMKISLNSGSVAQDYQRYVGGIPSPNPDYPQQIDTVTGEQTVSVVGKNLFNKSATPFRTGTDFYSIPVGSTITAGTSANVSVAQTSNGFTVTNTANWNGAIFLTEVKPQTSYNLKYAQTGSGSLARSTYYTLDSNYTVLTKAPISSDNFTVNTHIATTADTKYIAVSVGGSSATTVTITEPQLELGSTSTTYQPYQSQSYTIDLGATELCKIGNYQDYIWKDGDTWKVHKEVGKLVYNGTEANWQVYVLGDSGYTQYYRQESNVKNATSIVNAMSDYFRGIALDDRYRNSAGNGVYTYSAGIAFNPYTAQIAGLNAWKTWLGNHNTTVYYALATATDTQITDANLIAQLEALASSTTYAPQTNYTTSTLSPNLPTILTIDVFKDNYAGLLARLEKAGA